EDGIRDFHVTGVQTCALPILHESVAVLMLEKHERLAQKLHRLHGPRALQLLGERHWLPVLAQQLSGRRTLADAGHSIVLLLADRSEERRVGKECRSRSSAIQ